SVFILHSNLGLILFKQGKLDEAEHYLLRAIELRPNYAKSHLYLGLLYRQRRKFGLALEHLRFAGADKLVREVELDMQPKTPPMPGPRSLATDTDLAAHTAARKLQEAVDDTVQLEEKRIDLGARKIEGASKTFALHENGFLEINFARNVHVKRGTVSSYSGNL